MRKLSLLFVLVITAITTGCNKQEELERPSRPVLPNGKASITIAGDSVIATRSTSNRVEFTGGYATGAGLYDGEAQATVEAVANPGYRLSSFSGGPVQGDPNHFVGDSKYDFKIQSQDWRFSVIFKKEFKITVNAETGGRVTGGGMVLEDENCTVVAYPDNGYEFKGWYENGAIVSSVSSYTFKVSSNRTITAFLS